MAPASCDLAVVGGGVIGCCVAYYAARAGLRVALLERDGLLGATSGSCMGHLMVVPDPAPMHDATRASVRLWGELQGELGFELAATGALWLAENGEDLALLQGLAQTFHGRGAPGAVLDRAELREREPGLAEDLPGAFLFPEDGVLMPMQAARVVLAAAVAAGAQVHPHTPVRAIARGKGGAVEAVVTDAGAWPCGAVVIAAGVWSPALAALAGVADLPVYPRRGDLAITMPRECPVRHQLLEVAYLRTTTTAAVDPTSGAADAGANALNVQPQSNGTCLIGSTRQFAGMRRVVDRRLLARSLARAVRFVPALDGARVVRTWAGLRPYSRDKLPLVGPVPQVQGLWLATGHEGLGITLAPVSGLLLAQMMTGAAPVVAPEPFAPARPALREGAHV